MGKLVSARARVRHTHTRNNTKSVVRRLAPATVVASVGTPCRETRRFAERCSLWSHINLIGIIGDGAGRPAPLHLTLRSRMYHGAKRYLRCRVRKRELH